MDLWDIFLVFPEIKARAFERAFTAPSSLIISSAISLKY
jgi:hypothetical protein